MARHLAADLAAAKHFLGITIQTIPRGSNEAADKLKKLMSSSSSYGSSDDESTYEGVVDDGGGRPNVSYLAETSRRELLMQGADWLARMATVVFSKARGWTNMAGFIC